MKQISYFIGLTLIISSCNQDKDDLSNLVVINEKGVQENKGDTLSVEDVIKLESATDGLAYSYSSILAASMEKSYPFTSDSGKLVKCILTSDDNKARLILFKEVTRYTKVDSTKNLKIIDFAKIGEGDSISDRAKKLCKYKAVVKLDNHLGGDSTVKFVLNIFKTKD